MGRVMAAAVFIAGAAVVACGAEKDTGKVLLWEVRSKTATVYVLASLHVTDGSVFPLDDTITKAYKESDALVMELDMSAATQTKAAQLMAQRGMYPGQETIVTNLSAEGLAKLKAYLAKEGMSIAAVSKMRPWMLSVVLEMQRMAKLGYNPQSGLEMYFAQTAAKDGKEVLGLETPEEQVEALAGSLGDMAEKELLETLSEPDSEIRELTDGIIAAWKAGDADGVQEIVDKEFADDPMLQKYQAKILDNRSALMAERIRKLLATDKKYFVAVGAGHAVGEKGLAALLGKDYEVKQLDRAKTEKATAGAPEQKEEPVGAAAK
jgi:hypothetical protein